MNVDLNENDIGVVMSALDLFIKQNGLRGAGGALAVSMKIEAARKRAELSVEADDKTKKT